MVEFYMTDEDVEQLKNQEFAARPVHDENRDRIISEIKRVIEDCKSSGHEPERLFLEPLECEMLVHDEIGILACNADFDKLIEMALASESRYCAAAIFGLPVYVNTKSFLKGRTNNGWPVEFVMF